MFEKDISEAVGFTLGAHPHRDIKEAGMLGLIALLSFIESAEAIYPESSKPIEE